MQNFFLSPALGRDRSGPGHQALAVLERLVPKLRQGGVRVVWCNWGLTQDDITHAPPAVLKGFGALNGFRSQDTEVKEDSIEKRQPNIQGETLVDTKPSRIYQGFGTSMGEIKLESGETIDAGRLLMPNQWNSQLPPRLQTIYEQGRKLDTDVWVDKTRMSGLWNDHTPLANYLRQNGIKSLLFAGVNTDQCVQGTLVDGYNRGWDCILVKDACGTGTPGGKDVSEWNTGRSWGFLVDSIGVERGLEGMLRASTS